VVDGGSQFAEAVLNHPSHQSFLLQGPLQVVWADVAPRVLDPPPLSSSTAAAGCKGNAGGASKQCGTSGGGAQGCCGEGAAAATSCSGAEQQPGAQGRGASTAAAAAVAADAGGVQGGSSSGSDYSPPPLGGLIWQPPSSSNSSSSGPDPPSCILWLGPPSGPALTHIQLTHSAANWVSLDPAGGFRVTTGLSDGLDRLLKRRYYLMEKARGAGVIGLLVGTLGAAGYLDALEALRQLAKAVSRVVLAGCFGWVVGNARTGSSSKSSSIHNIPQTKTPHPPPQLTQADKKTYTLLMGKPNPAKLANFPEIEVFVMVAEPQGLILDSKEFLAPIITPHEALLALTGQPFEAGSYRLDYSELLRWQRDGGGCGGGYVGAGDKRKAAAVAAAAAAAGESDDEGEEEEGEGGERRVGVGGGAIVVSGGLQVGRGSGGGGSRGGAIVARDAAEYLQKARTFQGLETPATGAEIKPAELAAPGRSGRAAVYQDEPKG
jgi:diphthamide biosynthesis protein 2